MQNIENIRIKELLNDMKSNDETYKEFLIDGILFTIKFNDVEKTHWFLKTDQEVNEHE